MQTETGVCGGRGGGGRNAYGDCLTCRAAGWQVAAGVCLSAASPINDVRILLRSPSRSVPGSPAGVGGADGADQAWLERLQRSISDPSEEPPRCALLNYGAGPPTVLACPVRATMRIYLLSR